MAPSIERFQAFLAGFGMAGEGGENPKVFFLCSFFFFFKLFFLIGFDSGFLMFFLVLMVLSGFDSGFRWFLDGFGWF